MKRFGYELQDDEQIKIGIVNTLDLTDKPISLYLPQNQSTENSKQDAILAIIGNPPYLYHSKNSSTIENEKIGKKNIQQKNAIGELLETYMYIDGQRIKERNPKGLQDDYVKFFRFAQHLIDQTENGIVAIITNHSFLDNPTFRGMRKSLMNSFNHLYFVDLHGNSKRKETAIENITDENVFSISQGVAISIMIKQKGLDKRVFRTDLWGRRQDKILQLQNSSLNLMKWRVLLPTAPYYLFTKQNETPDNDYFSFWSLKNIFAKYSVGVITSNDAKFIDFKRDTLEKRMMQFDDKYDKHWIKPILYRPFDIRYIYYKPELLQRARQKIMTNMFFENQAIITSRIIKDPVFQHCILSNTITNSGLLATNTSSSSYIFPLYCSDIKIKYNHSNQSDGLSETPQQKSNFSKQFCEFINQRYPTLAINDLFNYIYAMLYSKLYRMKYADYLKIDFPHIPFCNSFEIVKQISELGKGLIAAQLHGQFPEGTYKDLCKFVGNLDGVIEKLVYTKDSDEKGKLYINGKQYFEQMPLCVYNYEIGSYQVIARYLKDRKNRPIEQIDIDTIERNVKIIAYTIDISDKIDKLAEAWI